LKSRSTRNSCQATTTAGTPSGDLPNTSPPFTPIQQYTNPTLAAHTGPEPHYTQTHNAAQQILQFSDASSNTASDDDEPHTASTAAILLYDSSDDADMSHFTMKFVQGSPQDGDATLFMKAFLRYIPASRMSDWSLKKQAFACAAACDDVTEAAIEEAIALGHFTIGARSSLQNGSSSLHLLALRLCKAGCHSRGQR
jgi:hypothetical protein